VSFLIGPNWNLAVAWPSVLTLVALTTSCSPDLAEREYMAALRGENEGMSRSEQIAHIDRAIELQPKRAAYWETRAIYRIDQRAFEAAKADLDQAVKLQERPYLRFLRGLVLCQRGRPGDALADFDTAISQRPENPQFYRGRALALAAVGRAQEALQDAERLIRKAPQWGESHYARGIALTRLGRDEEAIQAFSEAMRRRPELVYPLRARADAYQRMGDSIRAAADRAEAEKREKDRLSCAPCSDPFRY
jgi:tetratricopeptide (TPR) repeat protein